jgi:adenylate kinase
MIELADKIFHMIDTKQEFILDGFPRTEKQAEWLIAQHKAGLITISAVFHLEASEAVVTQRLLERGRMDDTKEAISARFAEYRSVTLPMITDFITEGVTVHHIDGEGAPEEVHAHIMQLMSSFEGAK